MFNFNHKKTAIFGAVEWGKNPIFILGRPLTKLFFIFFIVLFLIFLYGFFTDGIARSVLLKTLGLSAVFLSLSVIYALKESFLNFKLKHPRLKVSLAKAAAEPGRYNLAEFLSFEAAKAVLKSIKFAGSKKIQKINSSLLFYFILSDNQNLNFVFSRAIIDRASVKKILSEHLKILSASGRGGSESGLDEKLGGPGGIYSNDFQDTIIESLGIASKKGHSRIEVGDVAAALSEKDQAFRKILVDSNLKSEDIWSLTEWMEFLEEKMENKKRFWDYKNLAKRGSLAKEWSSGYTITLDRFAIDWTDFVRSRGFAKIIGHQKEIVQLERILSRIGVNNALVIGEPGSGRGSIIEALAQRCLFGESLPRLNYKRVVELDVASLLAQTDNLEEVEAILAAIFKEIIAAGNIILVINEFHNFIGQLVRPGVIDISGVLSPYLKADDFQLAAVTTYAGLHKHIEQNPSIPSFFEKVEVSEITERETIMLLENLALGLEQKYKKFVTYPAIRDIVLYSKKYMQAVSFPKKAIDLLDEILVYVSQSTKDDFVLPKHVAAVISEKTQIPVGELKQEEKETLLNLEELLHKRIINQEEAVSEVSTAMRRTRAQVTIRKGPMGVFLFLGPTGVGKTETSKALAEIYFGSEEKMIRLDMSEFQTVDDIQRIIGSEKGEGILTTQVREAPFSLILLDEFEKAHPNVLNLFLQVFDEGNLRDGSGRRVDFSNCLIIATSNAGYQIILDALKTDREMPGIKNKLLDSLFKEGVFKPELINRFDAVVVFKSLTKENLMAIAELLLKKLKNNLDAKGIEFIITSALKEKIVELGYSPVFGAREMRRVIQDRVENVLAVALLSGRLKRGDRAEVLPENFDLDINGGRYAKD